MYAEPNACGSVRTGASMKLFSASCGRGYAREDAELGDVCCRVLEVVGRTCW